MRTLAPSVALHRQRRPRDHLRNVRVLVADDQQAARRKAVRQAPEGALHVREVPVDVGVVELDAREHRGSRSVVQELRSLVEEGGVVLVALDDDRTPVSQPVVALEVLQNAADHEGGLAPGGLQDPGEEGRGGGLAVGARHHQALPVAHHKAVDGLGHGAERQAQALEFDRLRVQAGDGVSHHHEIRPMAEVLGPEAVHDPDAAAGEKIAHGRVDLLIGARDLAAQVLEHAGQGPHGRTAHGHQVHPAHIVRYDVFGHIHGKKA